ncbi:MAG: hypothetical protein FD176_2154 [Rhodospirillaceae bacterium]|nr:MAG: hypothetical protein FD176_2154 [Rhodospirillaceae bacterium]TNC96927.1 MAG: hypothetical protein FD119_1433 [Stygiobacter sp.]
MIRTLSAAACIVALTIVSAQAAPMTKDGMLVDDKGMTLYTFDKDEMGKSNCDAACLANWPAAKPMDGESAKGELSVITRADGTKQWAYKGKPLYLWAKDAKPGDMTGDGIKGVWHVAKP